ncbi:MAG: tRNA pseudouridine(55) synthase TruB [Treponema sp.]|jgi:tRNA pseudouridine55 synthase|nr:tRNA pseudouridine(55) synthase TruB [Treponema sp.]
MTGEYSGLLLLNKTPGITSFEALRTVKKVFATNKVGHTGTLDKFATGLLLVLVGRAVKLASWVSGADKQYEGLIRFGVETDTLDPEGVSIAEGPIPTREALEGVLPLFRGDILQAPPEYSAVHVAGERASRLARQGMAVDLPKRTVSVYALELCAYEPPLARIRVHCSKGTYIRSLARDLACAAGSRGHLVSLNRTHIAGFPVSEAVELGEDVSPAWVRALKPIDPQVFQTLSLPWMLVDDAIALKMIHGKPLDTLIDEGKLSPGSVSRPKTGEPCVVGVFRESGGDTAGTLVGIIEKKAPQERGGWSYGYVYARA